ncbi:MAG: ribosome silencing factor [Candidatus Goldbacteria bacterium]|nr:ribosome silencing factor [Candidatus Goldiibacteriota bacterium]
MKKTNEMQVKLKKIIGLLEEKKAQDVVILDTSKQSDIWDYFILCSALSGMHIKALKNYVLAEMKKNNYFVSHNEGDFDSNWVVLDYGDFLLHIFDDKTRKYYALEKLWSEDEIKMVKTKKEGKNEKTRKNKN